MSRFWPRGPYRYRRLWTLENFPRLAVILTVVSAPRWPLPIHPPASFSFPPPQKWPFVGKRFAPLSGGFPSERLPANTSAVARYVESTGLECLSFFVLPIDRLPASFCGRLAVARLRLSTGFVDCLSSAAPSRSPIVTFCWWDVVENCGATDAPPTNSVRRPRAVKRPRIYRRRAFGAGAGLARRLGERLLSFVRLGATLPGPPAAVGPAETAMDPGG